MIHTTTKKNTLRIGPTKRRHRPQEFGEHTKTKAGATITTWWNNSGTVSTYCSFLWVFNLFSLTLFAEHTEGGSFLSGGDGFRCPIVTESTARLRCYVGVSTL